MSEKARQFVEQELRGAKDQALAMWELLADCADDHGVITMSQQEIADRGGIHRNTVAKYVQRWTESGALGQVTRFTSTGRGKVVRHPNAIILSPFDRRTPMGRVPKAYRDKLVNPWV